ncbi:MAG: ATP-binding protein [Candidatus Babeliales bacterium]
MKKANVNIWIFLIFTSITMLNAMEVEDLFQDFNIESKAATINQKSFKEAATQTNFDNSYQNNQYNNLGILSESNQDQTIDPEFEKLVIENTPKELREIIEEYKKISNEEKNIQIFNYNARKYIPRKFLLVGQPGCGKSILAKVIAQNAGMPYKFISTAGIANEFKNSGIQNLSRLFQYSLNTSDKMAFIFDELSGMTDRHGQANDPETGIIQHFLSLLDQCKSKDNILIIATINDPKTLPESLKSRFFNNNYIISIPSIYIKKQIIKYYLLPEHNLSDIEITRFAKKVRHLPSRELQELVEKANFYANKRINNKNLSDKEKKYFISDLEKALNNAKNANLIFEKSTSSIIKQNLSQHWPTLLQITGNLALQYYMGKLNLIQSKEIATDQLDHAKLINEQQSKQLEKLSQLIQLNNNNNQLTEFVDLEQLPFYKKYYYKYLDEKVWYCWDRGKEAAYTFSQGAFFALGGYIAYGLSSKINLPLPKPK